MMEEDKADWEMKREKINGKLLRLFQIYKEKDGKNLKKKTVQTKRNRQK